MSTIGKSTLANWNGEILPLEEVKVSVLDRAFLFGDAVYEALRVYSGRPWLCDRHLARLQRSLNDLRIPANGDRLRSRLFETLERSGVQEGLIYIQVTRGTAPRRHSFPDPPAVPNELIWIDDYGGDPYKASRHTGVGCITFDDWRWERRDIKSVNLLGNCLAAQAAREARCEEAILIERDGLISEASHSSVFAVDRGCLLTAPQGHHILPGITRQLVLELAQKATIPTNERSFHKDQLFQVDELFLTGTSTEVLPIVRVDGRTIGDGKPGPITQRLAATYRAAVEDWLSRAESA